MSTTKKRLRYKVKIYLRAGLLIVVLAFTLKDGLPDRSRSGRIHTAAHPYEFNYVAWEVEALWSKARQSMWGYQSYVPEKDRKAVILEYIDLVGQMFDLEAQLEATYTNPSSADRNDLRRQIARLDKSRAELQPIVEPMIESQVSTVLAEQGFGVLGQIVPPVSFRFLEPPDVLVVSPREVIRQDFAISLRSLNVDEAPQLEKRVEIASPNDSAYVTSIGGVGIWPAMVIETRYPAYAFEIVAHEWSHHYLFMFPLGLDYLALPETRIINETTATVFGNAMALLVLDRFYHQEVEDGSIWVPDYPTLADFQPQTTDNSSTPETTEPHRDPDGPRPTTRGTIINRTRITADYLLALGRVDAAEAYMESRRQWLGMRVLNQAWFAFNGGYQADPGQGGGVSLTTTVDVTDPTYPGDPIGPAIHEIAELAPNLADFLNIMRDVTTRRELIETLIEARSRWK
ncbi:MAG: hypothetical protein HY862_21790 [Chloroflexi bacterium]|nr:hypothetical protein [Chloroflexota bacterium]